MNYRHIYHAGNFADTFKHIILIALIQSLMRKENAFCYLDTHAGIGYYDLYSEFAQKSKEFENGIIKIIAATNPPSLIQDYLTCVKKLNAASELRYYPGSPYFVKCFLRPQDRMILVELHPEDIKTLKHFFKQDKHVAIHHQDGYQSLKAHLPPKERRGLILIDPPYEKSDELLSLPAVLASAIKRFETGIYAVWYPIKNRLQLARFYRELKSNIQRPSLITEFCIHAEAMSAIQLIGCGMVIINPPWQLTPLLEKNLTWLWNTLRTPNQGRFFIQHE
ncbi:MAG: Protein containing DUF519 [uncultured bacterium]|nr:MAG: Protein containing DUF519 [uncultured bacterium]